MVFPPKSPHFLVMTVMTVTVDTVDGDSLLFPVPSFSFPAREAALKITALNTNGESRPVNVLRQ